MRAQRIASSWCGDGEVKEMWNSALLGDVCLGVGSESRASMDNRPVQVLTGVTSTRSQYDDSITKNNYFDHDEHVSNKYHGITYRLKGFDAAQGYSLPCQELVRTGFHVTPKARFPFS
jgi:hypothetical protein